MSIRRHLQNRKPLFSPEEDSLPGYKSKRLAQHGWGYNPNKGPSGAWVAPKNKQQVAARKKNLRRRNSARHPGR